MWRHYIVRLLLLVIVTSHGSNAFKQFDLFEINGLSPDPIEVAGTKAVSGPFEGSLGIRFDEKTANIKSSNNYFAWVGNMVQTSNDLTFAVHFKILEKDAKEKAVTYFPFFALTDTKLLHNYFAIGLESEDPYTSVEGKKKYNGTIIWTIYTEQWVKQSRSSSRTTFPLGNKLKLNKWMVLMVRIRKEDVEVSLDCKLVSKMNLQDGRIGRFSYDGFMSFSQFFSRGGSYKSQFVGSLFEPQLINGKKAYDWYNPCTSDRVPSKIVPEPRPSEYNDRKFEKYQDMSQEESRKPVINCIDNNGKKRRNNGDAWIENNCNRYRCVDGEIVTSYICPKCEDDDGMEHKSGATWFDKSDPCKKKTCNKWQEIDTDTVECKVLECPKDEQYKPEGECCLKCKDDDCRKLQKRRYISGCERKCSDGGSFVCPKKEKGCWCPENTALNMEGTKCIPTRKCKCQEPGKLYLPGQSIRKSLCSICLCSHGNLVCFDTC